MKKRTGVKFAAIALAAATVVPIAAGCGAGGGTGGETLDVTKLDPTAVLQEARTNMNNLTAIDLSMDTDIEITSQLLGKEPMAMDMDIDIVCQQVPMQMMMEMDASVYGQKAYAGMYLVPDGDGYTAYIGEQESANAVAWEKASVTGKKAEELEKQIGMVWGNKEGLQQLQQLESMMEGAMSLKITGMEQVNGEDAIVMSGQVNMEDAMNTMSAVGGENLMGNMDGIEAMFDGVTVPVTYYIDADEHTMLKCEVDLKQMLDQVLGQAMNVAASVEGMEGMEGMDLSQMIQINTAYISMQLNAVNEEVADVVVPKEVIAQAVEVKGSIDTTDIPMLNGTMMGV